MKSPLSKLVSWQLKTGQLDGWTSYHIAAGAFLCKVFQWWGWSDFWCVMGVLLLVYYGKYLNTTLRIGNLMEVKEDGYIIPLQILLLKQA